MHREGIYRRIRHSHFRQVGEKLKWQVIEEMKNEKMNLLSKLKNVQEEVKTIEETEKVNDAVLEWLNDAEKLIEEVEKWVNPDLEVELYYNMLNKIKKLSMKCKFEPFSSIIPGLEYFSSSDFVCFNSTKVTSDELLKALKDNRSDIIGLYGTSGSGKTALAKAVGEKAKYLKIFDAVLFATVSQNSSIQILDQLANSLNLRLDKIAKVGRAISINLELKSKGPILVILDDVRERLDFLEYISILCKDNRYKVLLTTRYREVCSLMNCECEIPLQPLSEKEAWTLFKKYSGIDDESSSNLLKVAQNVALECNGLPSTIKDVGSSLKSKPIEELEAMLHCLTHSEALYHVFLSFCGDDTRHSFTGFLYDALCQEEFKTFMDDRLERGKPISDSLCNAIEASRLSIIILSENYAYSPWCLDELVTILECMKNQNHNVLPIFYKIEPSDVRPKNNTYGKAMADHAKKYDSDRVKRWRSALYEVSHLSGECYVNDKWYEYEFIQEIVKKVNNMKNRLYIQTSMETINDEQREKMSNPNNCRTRKNTTLGVSCSASSASMLRKRTCCGESLMPIMSTSLNNPRHTFWACPNWKVDEDSTEQELEEEEKILRLKRELDVERRKRKLMLCVIVSWALTFMVWLGCTRLCRFWNEKMSPVLLQ